MVFDHVQTGVEPVTTYVHVNPSAKSGAAFHVQVIIGS